MCPVDLTRTLATTKPNTDKDANRKLAFSVENILDPNKFCSKKEQINTRHWMNGYDRDDHIDDDQSESQSGKFFFIYKLFILYLWKIALRSGINLTLNRIQFS